jgi:hypothetical protein
MSVPPKPASPGEEGGRRDLPAWEYPGLDARLARLVLREGTMGFKGRSYDVRDGYAVIGGEKYMVLGNIRSPEFSFKVPIGLNAAFDGTCESMGDVEAAGRLSFTSKTGAKAIAAYSIAFNGGLSAWGAVHARAGAIEGSGDVVAAEVKAAGNVVVYGGITARLIMSRDGFLSANDLTGEAILGSRGVMAMGGRIGYGEGTSPPQRSISVVWSNEGRIYSAGDIATGKICSAQDILTSDGNLRIEGDAFCLGAKINGQVLDGRGGAAAERVYSRRAWECRDADGRTVRMPPKDVSADDLERKLERTPFAWDRWERYFKDYGA